MAKILVVDDEFMVAQSTQFLLKGSGHEVQMARSVSDAKKKIGEQSFDLVVSDYNMKPENGVQLAQWIKDNNKQLPFILYSGNEEADIKDQNSGYNDLKNSGVISACVRKPSDDLPNIVSDVLKKTLVQGRGNKTTGAER